MRLALLRDESTQMPAVDPEVTNLSIWHCKYQTLRPIAALRKLRTLVIASYLDDTLSPLELLTELRYLEILHLPKVQDLAPLTRLTQLEVLKL
ncbi:MAG TPA: hypothetical protein VG755_01105, partial [Nannocystaceae bacterium]|nr:hypothetical protein [Nannocystaceae bacterium]